jgi:hypothetical protein
MLPLPFYIEEYILGFVDFHTMIKLRSVPIVYRYLLSLARFVDRRTNMKESTTTLAKLEKYYHLNGYTGLTVFDIDRFLRGYRIPGNDVSINLTRQLWINKGQYHRIYGPSLTYGSPSSAHASASASASEHSSSSASASSSSSEHAYLRSRKVYKCVWYYCDMIHRLNYPAITLYHENGNIKCELYYYYDQPYSYNGYPTAIEYTDYGTVKTLYWHDSDSGRVLKHIKGK